MLSAEAQMEILRNRNNRVYPTAPNPYQENDSNTTSRDGPDGTKSAAITRLPIIPFDEWISNLDLSHVDTIEEKVNEHCIDVVRRSSPTNLEHYNAVLQGHLLLEVWTQIVGAVEESFVSGSYWSHAVIEYDSKLSEGFNQRKSVRITLRGINRVNSKYIESLMPYNSYILLLWRDTHSSKKKKGRESKPTQSTASIFIPHKPSNHDQLQSKSTSNDVSAHYPPNLLTDDLSTDSKPIQSPTYTIRGKRFAAHCCVQISNVWIDDDASSLMIQPKLDPHSWKRLLSKMETMGTKMTVVPIPNLVGFQREYDAVFHLDKMPLAKYLFHSPYSPTPNNMDQNEANKLVANLWSFIGSTQGALYYQQNMNSSQFKALRVALMSPLTLIHGPPGTGKTKCVLLPILKCAFNGLQSLYYNANHDKIVHALHQMDAALRKEPPILFGRGKKNNKKRQKKWEKAMTQWQKHVHNEKLKAIDYMLVNWTRPRLGVFAGSNQAVDQIIDSVIEINANKQLTAYQRYDEIQMGRIGSRDNMTPNIASFDAINLNFSVDFYLSMRWDPDSSWTEYSDWKTLRIKKTRDIARETAETIYALKLRLADSLDLLMRRNQYDFICSKIDELKRKLLEQSCLDVVLNAPWPNQARKLIELKFMNETICLFSTANYIGKYRNELVNRFDFGLFDECCQMQETQTLVAFQYCHRSVLIGDPKQLQPTVMYQGSHKPVLQQSLFDKLQKKHDPILLDEQYRMHPQIALFPSNHFYDAKLKNGRNCNEDTKGKPYHDDESGLFGPYLFEDVEGAHLESRGYGHAHSQFNTTSLVNHKECEVIKSRLKALVTAKNGAYIAVIKTIGIITPYSAQKMLITDKLKVITQQLKEKGVRLEVVTVDEFQGSERDIIILSCVRSNGQENIGFLADARRLNVALTRAKHSLWIFGNVRCLQNNAMWNALIMDAHRRGLLLSKASRTKSKSKQNSKEFKEKQSAKDGNNGNKQIPRSLSDPIPSLSLSNSESIALLPPTPLPPVPIAFEMTKDNLLDETLLSDLNHLHLEYNKKELCPKYGSAKGCKWGTECSKSHDNPNSVPFCPLINTAKGCSYGKRCYDRHQVFGRSGDEIPMNPFLFHQRKTNNVSNVDWRDEPTKTSRTIQEMKMAPGMVPSVADWWPNATPAPRMERSQRTGTSMEQSGSLPSASPHTFGLTNPPGLSLPPQMQRKNQ